MAEDVSDLIIRMEPRGVETTEQGLQRVEEGTQETTEALEEQSEASEGFLQKFEGAMSAAVAALAVASAGLLSQVPVIGEALSGLFAIVEAIAFQIDQVLRPVLSPLTNALFDLSGAIFELNGPAGKLVGVIGTIVSILGVAAGIATAFGGAIAGIKVALGGLAALAAPFVAALQTLALIGPGLLAAHKGLKALWGFGLPGAIQKLIGWVMQLRGVFLDLAEGIATTVFDVGAAVRDIVVRISQGILGVVADALTWGGKIVLNLAQGMVNTIFEVGNAITEIATTVSSAIKGLIAKAYSWGANIVSEFASGVKSNIDKAVDGFKSLAKKGKDFLMGNSPPPEGPLSNIDKAGPILVETVASGVEANAGRLGNAASRVAAAGREGLSGGETANLTNGDSQQVIEVDGRTLGRTTSRTQRSITASRNIDG